MFLMMPALRATGLIYRFIKLSCKQGCLPSSSDLPKTAARSSDKNQRPHPSYWLYGEAADSTLQHGKIAALMKLSKPIRIFVLAAAL